jgi:hypothetical protein
VVDFPADEGLRKGRTGRRSMTGLTTRKRDVRNGRKIGY